MTTDRLDLRTAAGIWIAATRSGAVHALDPAAKMLHRTPPPEAGVDPADQPWIAWEAIGCADGDRDVLRLGDGFWYLHWVGPRLRAHLSTQVIELREATPDDLADVPPLAQ